MRYEEYVYKSLRLKCFGLCGLIWSRNGDFVV